jgi:biotin transport system substrate-specific component
LQTLAVVLAGAALGSRRGGLAMLLYLAEGAAGLPIFASGGGPLYLLAAPTAGYLWSYPVAAFVVGLLCERGLDRRYLTSILAMLPGSLIIYMIGVPWLAAILHVSLLKAFMLGMLLFIPGDLLKLLIAAALLPTAWAIVHAVKPEKS